MKHIEKDLFLEHRQIISNLIENFRCANEKTVMSSLATDIKVKIDGVSLCTQSARIKIVDSIRAMSRLSKIYNFRISEHTLRENEQECYFNCSVHMFRIVDEKMIVEFLEVFIYIKDGLVNEIHVIRPEKGCRRHTIETKDGTVYRMEHQIRLIESQSKKLLWHCVDGIYTEKRRMKDRSPFLSDCFVEVRKSHWVNMDFVDRIVGNSLFVLMEDPVLIPKEKRNSVKEAMREWRRPFDEKILL